MKKIICFLSLITFILCSCGKTTIEKIITFPQTNWNMTPEEVMDAFDTDQEHVIEYMKQEAGCAFGISNLKLFGTDSDITIFQFVRGSANTMSLAKVTVIYPDTAEMGKVADNLKKSYGKPVSKISFFGTSLESVGNKRTMNKTVLEETEHVKFWESGRLIDCLNEGAQEDYRNFLQTYYGNSLKDDIWSQYMEEFPLASIQWTDEAGKDVISEYSFPSNKVVFDASAIASLKIAGIDFEMEP